MSKLHQISATARTTEVKNHSKATFLLYFYLTRGMSFLLRRARPVGEVVKKVFMHLPHPEFVIKNSIGIWSVVPFNDTMTISAPYFESAFAEWPSRSASRRTFIDIGANIGRYTLLAANRHRYARILSIEANPFTFSILKKNISLNAIEDKVTAENVAAGNREGNVSIQFDTHHLGGGNVLRPDSTTSRPVMDTKTDIHMMTIDALVAMHHLDPREVDFVKIDVEGMEVEVLEGMRGLLSGMSVGSHLMVEISDESRVLNLLSPLGFERIESTGDDNLFIKR